MSSGRSVRKSDWHDRCAGKSCSVMHGMLTQHNKSQNLVKVCEHVHHVWSVGISAAETGRKESCSAKSLAPDSDETVSFPGTEALPLPMHHAWDYDSQPLTIRVEHAVHVRAGHSVTTMTGMAPAWHGWALLHSTAALATVAAEQPLTIRAEHVHAHRPSTES